MSKTTAATLLSIVKSSFTFNQLLLLCSKAESEFVHGVKYFISWPEDVLSWASKWWVRCKACYGTFKFRGGVTECFFNHR